MLSPNKNNAWYNTLGNARIKLSVSYAKLKINFKIVEAGGVGISEKERREKGNESNGGENMMKASAGISNLWSVPHTSQDVSVTVSYRQIKSLAYVLSIVHV